MQSLGSQLVEIVGGHGSVRAGGGEGELHAGGAHLVGRDRERLGEAGRDLAQSGTGAGEMQDPDRLEVELVGPQLRLGDAEIIQNVGEPSDPGRGRLAQAQQHDVGDLLLQLRGLADEGERAVEKGGMRDAVVGERRKAVAEPFARAELSSPTASSKALISSR